MVIHFEAIIEKIIFLKGVLPYIMIASFQKLKSFSIFVFPIFLITLTWCTIKINILKPLVTFPYAILSGIGHLKKTI